MVEARMDSWQVEEVEEGCQGAEVFDEVVEVEAD